MSTTAVIGIGYAVCIALLGIAIWRISRTHKTTTSSSVDDWETCVLLWSLPAYNPDTDGPDVSAGLDRLLRDIHDDKDGDQA